MDAYSGRAGVMLAPSIGASQGISAINELFIRCGRLARNGGRYESNLAQVQDSRGGGPRIRSRESSRVRHDGWRRRDEVHCGAAVRNADDLAPYNSIQFDLRNPS